MTQFANIGVRLRDERLRLGMTQTAFGEAGGVTQKTQWLYEADKRKPDSDYLSAIAAAGADVLYILTARRFDELIEARRNGQE